MASGATAELARVLNIHAHEKLNPFGKEAAAGSLDGFPILAAHTRVQNQNAVSLLVRFKKASLQLSPQAFEERLRTSPELLRAMDREKLPEGKKSPVAHADDRLLFVWPYSFRRPKTEKFAAAARALVDVVKGVASPVGSDCDMCGRKGSAQLFTSQLSLDSICPECLERATQEDRQAEATYERRPSNPVAGTMAGAATAVVMAALWGGLAFAANRIFLWGTILIGLAIAWAVNKGMGKVNWYGRILTCVLTVAAVLLGDFFTLLLTITREQSLPLSWNLAKALAPHFFEIEFSQSTGFVSVLFGLFGALFILYVNRRPVAKRTFSRVGAGLG